MEVWVHQISLPYLDPESSLEFYRDGLGFEVRQDAVSGTARRIIVGPVDRLGVSILLEPPAAEPRITQAERDAVMSMIDKGVLARVSLATRDLDSVFDALVGQDVDVLQEPIDRSHGERDFVVLDPAATIVRVVDSR